MGNCCNSIEPEQIINTKEHMFLKKSVSRLNLTKQKQKSVSVSDQNLIINLDSEKSSFQLYINNLIINYRLKYSQSSNFIEKISLEQLWNIVKFYQFDTFKNKNIILDLRKNPTSIFIKYFTHISYKIEEMLVFNQERLLMIKNFLYSKSVLILLDYKSNDIESLDMFIEFVIKNNFKTCIKIVNYNFEENDIGIHNNSNIMSYGNSSSKATKQQQNASKNEEDIKKKYDNEINSNSNNSYFNSLYLNKAKSQNLNNMLSHNNSDKYNSSSYISEGINKLFLINNIDIKEFEEFPYILSSLKYFSTSVSDKMIFFDYYDKFNSLLNHLLGEKYINDEISDKEILNNYYYRFGKYYKISGIIIFSKMRNSKSTSKPRFFHNNKFMINRITSISSFKDIENNIQEILNTILIMRSLLLKNKSIIFYFDKEFSSDIQIYLVLIIIYKLTDVKPSKLISYSKDNFVFIEDFEEYIQSNLFK